MWVANFDIPDELSELEKKVLRQKRFLNIFQEVKQMIQKGDEYENTKENMFVYFCMYVTYGGYDSLCGREINKCIAGV